DDLAASGAREIGVVAQDLLAWRDGAMGPADLVSELASRHPDRWFRLYYLNPRRFDESILEAMNRFRNLAPYLDIPVQHASDRVLARMNRGYGRAALERICDLVSHAGFDIACRFTVIAGYPGETDGDFEDLCSFLRGASSLRSLVAFPYWHEEGSVEYGRGDGDLVDPAIVDERLGILDSIGEEAAEAWGGRLTGRRISVLAETSRRGRTVFDAPMVDGSALFTSPVRAGAFREAIVEGCEGLSTTVTVSGGN
ncbi:MAG TPA: radical SAM protein, partial [Candidatus Fermentibacter sp.]|nr:radical SAM protein [Candidatus Fermentibacter sp.]